MNEPAWKQLGLKNKAQGWKKVIDNLFIHKENIIGRGFSQEVHFTLGDTTIILKGKNPGRKKDK